MRTSLNKEANFILKNIGLVEHLIARDLIVSSLSFYRNVGKSVISFKKSKLNCNKSLSTLNPELTKQAQK